PYFRHGHASIARWVAARVLPRAVARCCAEDVAMARVDDARLDEPGPARLRLNSTVVRARHTSDRGEVEVSYVRSGRLERVRARSCVLACWHGMIPYLCPELPATQREALAYATK